MCVSVRRVQCVYSLPDESQLTDETVYYVRSKGLKKSLPKPGSIFLCQTIMWERISGRLGEEGQRRGKLRTTRPDV